MSEIIDSIIYLSPDLNKDMVTITIVVTAIVLPLTLYRAIFLGDKTKLDKAGIISLFIGAIVIVPISTAIICLTGGYLLNNIEEIFRAETADLRYFEAVKGVLSYIIIVILVREACNSLWNWTPRQNA